MNLTRLILATPFGRAGRSARPRPAGRRRRAALAVVSFAVAAVAAQAAFHYPVGKLFPQFRDAHYGRKLARLRAIVAAEQGRRPVVVSTGSSLTEMGLCPAAMPGNNDPAGGRPVTYNFGLSNCGVVVHLMTLRRILEDGIRPDLVLIEVSPRFLYADYNWVYDDPSYGGNKQLLPPDRLQHGDLEQLARYEKYPHDTRVMWRAKQYLPWRSYRWTIQLAISPKLVRVDQRANYWSTDEWGWRLPPPGYNEAHSGYHLNGGGERLQAYYTHHFSHPHVPALEAAFLEMAALCRQYGVRYAYLLVPESSFLRNSCPADGASSLARLLRRARAEYGAEVIDGRDWVPDDEFSDGSHVLPSGAHRWSVRLEQDVLRRVFPPRP